MPRAVPPPPSTTATGGRRPATLTGSAARRSVALLWRGMRAHPGIYVLAVGSSAIFGALTVGVAQAVGWATNHAVVPVLHGDVPAGERVPDAVILLLAVAIALAIGVVGRRIFAGMGFAGLQSDHRRGLARQYLRLPMSWHQRHPAGQLLAHVSSDVDAATNVFNPLPFALGVVVMLGVSAVALVRIDPVIALVALAVIPVVIAANIVFQRQMGPVIARAQQMRGVVSDVAHESFEAALLVKAMGTADREQQRFDAAAQQLRAANVAAGTVRAVFDPVIDALPGLATLGVIMVGAVRSASGAVDTGDIVSASFLLTMLAVPVRAFGWVLGDLPRALVGHDRIARVLDTTSARVDGTARLTASGPATVEVSGVGWDAPDPDGPVTLLDDVTFTINPGAVVALVGSTGSGKSTLASLLVRLNDPTRGEVTIDGVPLRDVLPADRTDQLALVGQETFVFADTVRANVTLADDGTGPMTDDEVWAALETAQLAETVRALPGGLDTPLGERGANLSGGQRQRLALARAIARHPRFLVLDDATSAVDPQAEQRILAALRGHRKTGGVTVLLVAYRAASIQQADWVVHLDGGRVVDQGEHADLLARDPGYAAIVSAYEDERREAADEQSTELAEEAR